jgi:hypothetical protein
VAVTPAGLEQMFRELSVLEPGQTEQAVRICRRHAVDFV